MFTGCLVFVKGEIKKKQPQVRMLSVSFLIRTPEKGGEKTEMGSAMPVQVTQIRLDLNQVKNYFALCMVGQSGKPSCDHQMLKCERYLDLTRAVLGGECRITHADTKPFLAFFLIRASGKREIRLIW